MHTTILSGFRPTGNIHLGNYLGAIRPGIDITNEIDEHLFCIVDQHALTTAEDAKDLLYNTRLIAAAFVASGIDPDQSYIFAQSHVPGHTELAWYFSCVTPLGWLNRMTQFKDKSGKNKESANLGLLAYPVLMAADILIYKATHVPVGEDQKQHVELARDIAHTFNTYVNKDIFQLPLPVIPAQSARVMSLRDGTSKMSKSDISDYSRIHLMDDEDQLRLKIRKAKTDSLPIPAMVEELSDRSEAKNLLSIYATLTNTTLKAACEAFEGKLFSDFKKEFSDVVIAHIAPIRQKINQLMADQTEMDRILARGADRANERAEATLDIVRESLNFYPRPKKNRL